MYCKNCGAEIPDNAVICVKCGVSVVPIEQAAKSPCSFVGALLLCFFLGGFGAHRFYVGKTGTAIAQLLMTIIGVVLSLILVGYFLVAAVCIWVLVDLIMIIIGSFTDKNGLPVKP